jgi:hypothetical protein
MIICYLSWLLVQFHERLVNFVGIWYISTILVCCSKKNLAIMFIIIWYLLWLFGTFHGRLVYFVCIWYIFSILVHFTAKNLATLSSRMFNIVDTRCDRNSNDGKLCNVRNPRLHSARRRDMKYKKLGPIRRTSYTCNPVKNRHSLTTFQPFSWKTDINSHFKYDIAVKTL